MKKDYNDILKKILKNMNYNPSLNSNENESLINEQYLYPKDEKPSSTTLLKKTIGPELTANDSRYDSETLKTYQTVVPGGLFTVPEGVIKVKETHNSSEPFNQAKAVLFFGTKCWALAGKSDEFNVKKSQSAYWIDSKGEQCPIIGAKRWMEVRNVTSQLQGGKTGQFDYGRYSELDKTLEKQVKVTYYFKFAGKQGKWTVAKDNALLVAKSQPWKEFVGKNDPDITDSIEYLYASGCKPLDYDLCLKWSWNTLMMYGGVDKGISVFEMEEDGVTKVFSGCFVTPFYKPWEAEFTGFHDREKNRQVYVELAKGEKTMCGGEEVKKIPDIPEIYYKNKNNFSSMDDERKKSFGDELGNKAQKSVMDSGNIGSYRTLDGQQPADYNPMKYISKGIEAYQGTENRKNVAEYEKMKMQTTISSGLRVVGK